MSTQPRLITSIADLRSNLSARVKRGSGSDWFPPSGIAQGHLSLVRASKLQCGLTVVSIYVNPSQFGPREDLAKYPRTLQADLDALAALGVELVFAPSDKEMYPEGYGTWVEPGAVAEPLEGQCRSGYFRGVATVVLKLLESSGPTRLISGRKIISRPW